MIWFANFLRRVRGWFTPRYRAVAAGDLPERLAPRTLYFVGELRPWQAAMLCPCGCGVTIQLSLVPDDRPRWDATLDAGARPTLTPSVWRMTGCRSHFFVRHGRILWCG